MLYNRTIGCCVAQHKKKFGQKGKRSYLCIVKQETTFDNLKLTMFLYYVSKV